MTPDQPYNYVLQWSERPIRNDEWQNHLQLIVNVFNVYAGCPPIQI